MALKEFLDIDGLKYYRDMKIKPALDNLISADHTHDGLTTQEAKTNASTLKKISVTGTLTAGDEELILLSPYFRKDGLVAIYTSDFDRMPLNVIIIDGQATLKFKSGDTDLDIIIVVYSSQYQSGKAIFDSSDATATAQDIVKDKTAVIGNGLVTGTLEEYDVSYFEPGVSNQVIEAGKYTKTGFTIKGDENFVPENIAKGVELFGITGTYSGYDVNINGIPYASPVSDGIFKMTTDSAGNIYIEE